MPLPVQMFPALNQAQINPVAMGIGQANQLYAQGVQNQFLAHNMQAALQAKQLANQITQAQANVAPQMNAAQLAYSQAKTPNLNAATQFLLSGQIPEAQAQAGFIGTNAAKNLFSLKNPTTMLPGMAGQLGSLSILKNLLAAKNGSSIGVAPPPVGVGSGQIPGMPSAGNLNQTNAPVNGPLLPNSPYSAPGSQNGIPPLQSDGLPSTPDLMSFGMKSILAPMEKNIAQANLYNTKAAGFAFNSLPQNQKTYMIAQAGGLGIGPQEAIKAYYNGETVGSLAQQRGLDPNNLPTPLYAATPATVQLIQRRNQALNEINSIEPQITAGMSPYARQFAGYSPTQIADAMKNDNPDQQARFLASRALMPEMASLRLKAMGGNIGIEAIKEVNNQSMGNIKSFQGLVSPKVYTSAQNYVDQWINQGANAANKIGLAGSVGNLNNGGQPMSNATMTGANPAAATSGASSGALVAMKAPNGEIFHIPAANVQAALKRGAVQQ